MIDVEVAKVSSRGQIVIPQDIREKIHLKEGEAFAVTATRDLVVLKRLKTPSKEEILSEWKRITARARQEVKKVGIRERDVPKLVHRARGIKDV